MSTEVREVIIIGSGPAGYTAAVYAARANLRPVIFEGSVTAGGALMNTTEVENYPGFRDGIMGPDLMEAMRAQSERFGAELVRDDVTSVSLAGPVKSVTDGSGRVWAAHTVILAMGSAYREMGLPDEKRLAGRGVSWCATCDGFFFRDQDIAVVGGGDSAVEEATFLTKFARSVTIVHRRDELRASKIMADRALSNPKISFAWNSAVEAITARTRSPGSYWLTRSPAPPGCCRSPVCSWRSVTTRATSWSRVWWIWTPGATCRWWAGPRPPACPASSRPGTWSTTPTARRSPPLVRDAPRRWTPSTTSPPSTTTLSSVAATPKICHQSRLR